MVKTSETSLWGYVDDGPLSSTYGMPMRVYVITTGVIFGLLVVAHLWRMVAEPHLATDPGYLVITLAAALLGLWAGLLLRRSPSP